MRIGIVSDTHDRVLSSLHAELADVEEILHAGDVATTETLAEIETIAPVTAVRGNMDERPLADRLPEELVVERGELRIALVHGHHVGRASVDDLAKRYAGRRVDLVIWGHIHEPVFVERDGVRYFNPGTAGGIGAGATFGILTTGAHDFTIEHVSLA